MNLTLCRISCQIALASALQAQGSVRRGKALHSDLGATTAEVTMKRDFGWVDAPSCKHMKTQRSFGEAGERGAEAAAGQQQAAANVSIVCARCDRAPSARISMHMPP